MIHLRGGWKEVKVGSFFDFAAKGERAEEEYQVRAFDTTYCMWLGSVEQFAPLQWAEAERRQADAAQEVVCVSDAAAWIVRCPRLFQSRVAAKEVTPAFAKRPAAVGRDCDAGANEQSPTIEGGGRSPAPVVQVRVSSHGSSRRQMALPTALPVTMEKPPSRRPAP
jgi:hypothetical protein